MIPSFLPLPTTAAAGKKGRRKEGRPYLVQSSYSLARSLGGLPSLQLPPSLPRSHTCTLKRDIDKNKRNKANVSKLQSK